MIKASLNEAREYLNRKDLSVEKIKLNGKIFTSDSLIELHEKLINDRTLFNCFELDIKYYLSRRKALIVLLEEDYFNKTSYDFTNLNKYEFLASQRFELTNKEKRDLDTPQKVHPKNPCNYYNKDGMGYKKRQYKNALNEILKTPFYFFEVEKALENLIATRKKMEANDC